MIALIDAVLVLALAGGGDGAEAAARSAGRGLDPYAEPLQDLYRRIPSLRAEEERGRDEASQQEGEKQAPSMPGVLDPKQEETPAVDFSWLEIYPRIGIASFSSKYHVKPSACFGVAVRAPMPWLSPSSNPHGEYFGLFAELDVCMITRNIAPKLDKPSGPAMLLGVGVDYTFYRSESWLLMVEAGVHYANFGGITDLTNGLTPMAGVIAGISISRGLSLSISPEIAYPVTGDYIMMITLGLVWEF